MNPFEVIASWAGWPAVAGLLVLALGHGYWTYRERIATLKDTLDLRDYQIRALEESTPDVLARRLKSERDMYEDELARAQASEDASKAKIQAAEAGLARATRRIEALTDQMEDAKAFLLENSLVCPHCGAPLEQSQYYMETREYQGRELDVDYETLVYQCGLELVNGQVERPCTQEKSD